jgi:hypothetical protein
MSCTGNGRCMKPCFCKKICSCLDIAHEHIHDGITFCKVICIYDCKPIHCENPVCKETFPEFKYSKKCNTCNIFQIEFTPIQEECCICYKNKYMIKTHCNHMYCFDCLMDDQSEVIRCFICRTNILFHKI